RSHSSRRLRSSAISSWRRWASRSASLSIIGARSSIAWLVLTLRFRAASLAPLVGLCKRLLPFQPAAHPIPERFHLFADPGLRVAEAGSIQRKFLGLDLDVLEHVLLDLVEEAVHLVGTDRTERSLEDLVDKRFERQRSFQRPIEVQVVKTAHRRPPSN